MERWVSIAVTGKVNIISASELVSIDTTIRLLTIGGQMMMIAILLISRTRTDLKISLFGVLVGASAYLVNSSIALSPPQPWRMLVDFTSVSTTIWAWIFAHQLFERSIRRPLLIVAPLMLAIFWAVGNAMPDTRWFTYYAIHLLSLALVAHLIFIAVNGRADDLIERRRRIRTILPIFVGLQVGGVLTYEIIFGTAEYQPGISAMNAMFIMFLVLGAGMALFVAEQDIFSRANVEEQTPNPKSNLSPSESVLHDKLMQAMDEGVYRTSSLTITMLADHLDTPEHRLRALINRQLGHRNFSSFLNGYRVNEAKAMLADRDLVDLPILTIAMDLGYGSLAPFNRAFRSETGITPSDFRKNAIDQN
ncbi:helix-turn-helix domain-containing protein [Parasphingorhabdus sp.]|uniref:AraC family transcriptional regulator n=1 Tax=Parasphingorhabdus sp. TaxID=2709688 RepID=UPI003265364B